jgi:hypothetical protein
VNLDPHGKEDYIFDAESVYDKSYWYSKTVLKANDGPDSKWTASMKGAKLVTIESHDLDLTITVHKTNTEKKQVIKLPLHQLDDIMAAFMFMNEAFKRRDDRPSKISLVSKKKAIGMMRMDVDEKD